MSVLQELRKVDELNDQTVENSLEAAYQLDELVEQGAVLTKPLKIGEIELEPAYAKIFEEEMELFPTSNS